MHGSKFDASKLPSDIRAIANVFGACIVDDSDLQANLVVALKPFAEQLLEARFNSLEALIIGATFSLLLQKKPQVFSWEIAEEANRIQIIRGETQQIRPEMVGLKLRKVGIHTRRLGSKGNGLVFDTGTQLTVARLAKFYQL